MFRGHYHVEQASSGDATPEAEGIYNCQGGAAAIRSALQGSSSAPASARSGGCVVYVLALRSVPRQDTWTRARQRRAQFKGVNQKVGRPPRSSVLREFAQARALRACMRARSFASGSDVVGQVDLRGPGPIRSSSARSVQLALFSGYVDRPLKRERIPGDSEQKMQALRRHQSRSHVV